MIPLRVLLLRRKTAAVTLLLIAVNVFCYLAEVSQPSYQQRLFIAHYALVPDSFHWSALLTSMFLHGGILHLVGNMWFLWVFGSHLEEALGSLPFLGFYLASGVISALVQLAFNAGSPIPTLGASGAIAGVMGGFMLLYPAVRVVTLIFIVIFITTVEIPAAFMLLYWFAIQLLSGLGSAHNSLGDQGGVAWFAHVGGFLAGLLLVRTFGANLRRRPRYSY